MSRILKDVRLGNLLSSANDGTCILSHKRSTRSLARTSDKEGGQTGGRRQEQPALRLKGAAGTQKNPGL